MKELDFYKFIKHADIEYHWAFNPDTKMEDVIFFVPLYHLESMQAMMSAADYDDDRIQCIMKEGYLAFWAEDVLSRYDIDTVRIFGARKEQ